MNRIVLILVVLGSVYVSSVCAAQVARRWYRPPVGYHGPAVYGAYPRFSSTAMEGAAYGVSEVIRARGEAAESASRSINNYEDARSKYIDNAYKWTETYWARRRLGEAERAKDQAKARAARERYVASRKPSTPPRLGPDQLDPATGKLFWPEALMDDQYLNYRTKLEELFVLRVHTSTTPGLARKIRETADDMKSQLKQNIRKLRPNEYIAARKFLDGVAYEASVLPA